MQSRRRRIVLIALAVPPALCLLALAASVVSNFGAPAQSAHADLLSEADQARIAETQRLRRSLGNRVWPGWGDADIPIIVYNESYAFLVGIDQPADGWMSVPGRAQRGGRWEMALAEGIAGQPYYRQRLPADGATPQAFTVLVGERWVAALPTREWLLISLSRQMRDDFGPLFPHWWLARQTMGASERYIQGLAHESFHAFIGGIAADRLAAGENAARRWEKVYPWNNQALQTDWQSELDILARALRAGSEEEVAELARQFLTQRAARRQAARLSTDLTSYERWREWQEGLAKYAELILWREAHASPDYQPSAGMMSDSDFGQYAGFPQHWENELGNLTRRAGDEGDGRFYYTGMAQAVLLDRLSPEWKARAMQDNIWLEDLLAQALGPAR